MVLVRADGTVKSLNKHLSQSTRDELLLRTGAQPGDLLIMAAATLYTVVTITERKRTRTQIYTHPTYSQERLTNIKYINSVKESNQTH